MVSRRPPNTIIVYSMQLESGEARLLQDATAQKAGLTVFLDGPIQSDDVGLLDPCPKQIRSCVAIDQCDGKECAARSRPALRRGKTDIAALRRAGKSARCRISIGEQARLIAPDERLERHAGIPGSLHGFRCIFQGFGGMSRATFRVRHGGHVWPPRSLHPALDVMHQSGWPWGHKLGAIARNREHRGRHNSAHGY